MIIRNDSGNFATIVLLLLLPLLKEAIKLISLRGVYDSQRIIDEYGRVLNRLFCALGLPLSPDKAR